MNQRTSSAIHTPDAVAGASFALDAFAPEHARDARRMQRFLRYYPLVCGGLAALVGASVLVGWWLGLPRLTSFAPGLPPMVANTALATTLLGISLLGLAAPTTSRPKAVLGRLLAAAASMIAGLTLVEYALGLDLAIDQILVATEEHLLARYPGRPSPQTAATILMTGIALLTIDLRIRDRRPGEILALVSGLVPLLALLGYLFGIAALYGPLTLLPYTGMSIPTAVTLLVVISGIVAARANVGVLSVLTAEDAGGIMARRLAAWLLVLVPVVCAIAIGARVGLYTAPLASAFIVLAGLTAGSAFILLNARHLSQLDAKRREGEETRSRLASLVGSSDDAIIATTLDGSISHWNTAAERMYGYTSAEMVGRPLHLLVLPEHAVELDAVLASVRRGTGVRSLEMPQRRKDGTFVPVLVTVSPIIDAMGRILGASTIAHDISERKCAEDALRAAKDTEQRLRAELEELGRASSAVSEAVADLPRSDVATVLNMIALQARAITQADYVALGIGGNADEPFQGWAFLGMSQDVSRAIGRFPRPVGTLGRVAREGEVLRTADIRRHADFAGWPAHHPEMQSYLGVPILHRGRALGNLYLANQPGGRAFSDHDERLIRMLAARVGVAIETAMLYAAENLQRAWLQNVIDQMPDGVLLYDEHGRLRVMNPVAMALSCERTERLDPLGNPMIFDARGPDGRSLPPEQWPIVRALNDQEVIVREEMLLRRREGNLTPVLVCAAPVRDETGKLSGAMVILQDITERKELERLREEWAAVVAHDLRQPVSIVSLTAEALLTPRATQLPDRERRALERIRTASKHLSRMINDLLDASRIEAKRLEIDPRSVDLGMWIESVVDGFEDIVAGHPVRVNVEPEQLVWIDPDRIHQVLGNLISNAAKYGSSGSEIRIEAAARGDVVEVSVTNHGPGIAPEELSLLFSRFMRTRAAREGGAPGIGLGLYVAKGLVEAHGGRLWAESIPRETTTFHFTLPKTPRNLPVTPRNRPGR